MKKLIIATMCLSSFVFADVRFDNLVAIADNDYTYFETVTKAVEGLQAQSEIESMNTFLETPCPEVKFSVVRRKIFKKKVKSVVLADQDNNEVMVINKKKAVHTAFGFKVEDEDAKVTFIQELETSSNGSLENRVYFLDYIESKAFGENPKLAKKLCRYYSK